MSHREVSCRQHRAAGVLKQTHAVLLACFLIWWLTNLKTLPAAGAAGVLSSADTTLQGPRQDAGRLFDSDDNPGVALVQRIYNYCR